ncbi:PE-PPE domain-containing protein [Mycobacterium sp. NPDC048908]|uniref:PE-PPE domain-containing protein n=1 Tax=Mycobacterium sp. NPDC048908 TaxID=3364292 RepID=UPI003720852C
MAKHRNADWRRRSTDRHRQSPSLILVGSTAVALSAALTFGHATNTTPDSPQVELAAATIGVGGRGDPAAVNIPNKLQGNVVPFGTEFPRYVGVQYPAGYDIDNSVNAGVPALAQAIADNRLDENNVPQFLLVVGYSEGSLVAERVRRTVDPSDPGAPSTDNLQFVMIASPNLPNGGLAARFPAGWGIPFLITSNGPAAASPYDTQYVTNEYDPYADFPAYFNPLSLANSLVAVFYVHPDAYYDPVDYDPINRDSNDPNVLIKTVRHSVNGEEGEEVEDTYVFVRAEHLPLFAPLRQVAAMAQLTPLTEPVLGAIEPLVRLIVDMGYTDRQNLNPEKHVQFSLITPPGKVLEAVVGVPGALGQGATNLVGGVASLPTAIPTPVAPTSSPSINAKSMPQEEQPSLVGNDPKEEQKEEQKAPDSETSTTEPPASTVSDPEPTLAELPKDGNKSTSGTPGKATPPKKKNPLTQLTESVKGFSPKKHTPKTPTSSDPAGATPNEPSSQESTPNAA